MELLHFKIDFRKYLIFLILLVALGLRLFYFVGINLNDDTEYCDSAFRIATGQGLNSYPIGSIDSIRFLMILPIALFYRLFGVSDFTSSLYPLSCSILTILLAYFLAKDLFGFEVGIAAALMLAFFPLDIVYSTQLVPTVPLACALTACLLCFVKGDALYEENKKKGNFLFLLSGILLGIGWLINEPAPLFFIVIFLFALSGAKIRGGYLLFIIGAMGVFLAESALFWRMTGDFFWRLKIIHAEEIRVLTNTAMDYYPTTFFKLRDINFHASQGHFGLFWYLFITASIYLLAFWKKRAFFLLFGAGFILFYFQYGFMTMTGRPIAKWIRYMEMILPFVTMIVGFALISFGKMGRIKSKGWTLFILFLLSNLWFIPQAVEGNRSQTRPMKQIAQFLEKENPDKRIYIDAGAMSFVDVYLNKKRELICLENSSFKQIKDAYVVINGSRGVIENKEMRELLPWYGKNPPASWRLLKFVDAPIEGCFGKNPMIYYAPKG